MREVSQSIGALVASSGEASLVLLWPLGLLFFCMFCCGQFLVCRGVVIVDMSFGSCLRVFFLEDIGKESAAQNPL